MLALFGMPSGAASGVTGRMEFHHAHFRIQVRKATRRNSELSFGPRRSSRSLATRLYEAAVDVGPFDSDSGRLRHCIISRTADRKAASQGATLMPEKNLRELFHETLKDIYFAEKKIL